MTNRTVFLTLFEADLAADGTLGHLDVCERVWTVGTSAIDDGSSKWLVRGALPFYGEESRIKTNYSTLKFDTHLFGAPSLSLWGWLTPTIDEVVCWRQEGQKQLKRGGIYQNPSHRSPVNHLKRS